MPISEGRYPLHPDVKSRLALVSEAILETTQPQDQETAEHKLRNVVLEIFNRLPQNDVLRPYVPDLMQLVLDVLSKDNEENALVCIRIVFDLHKNYRPSLEAQAHNFLEFVCKAYAEFNNTYKHFFDMPTKVTSEYSASLRSFKVVTECPLVVMFLLQLYTSYVAKIIPLLLPMMRTALDISGPSVVKHQHRTAHLDLKTAQVKTVSFLTFLLRTHPDYIRPFQSQLASAIVRLLTTCPDNVPVRKEILVGIRHVLTTDMRTSFFSHIDALMETGVLTGSGLSCSEALRPLAYSFLAELIHHGRKELNISQLSRVVHIFCINMHDTGLPVSVQMTCIRLLINLIEALHGRRNSDSTSAEASRSLLSKLLSSFLTKLSYISKNIITLIKSAEIGKDTRTRREASMKDIPYSPLNADASQEVSAKAFGALPLLYLQCVPEEEKELSDTKQLILTLLMGLKTLLFSICHYNRSTQLQVASGYAPSQKLNESELRLVSKLIVRGTNCMRLFLHNNDSLTEAVAKLVDALTVLDSSDMSDIFVLRMGNVFQIMSSEPKLSLLSSHLLGLSTVRNGQQASKTMASYAEALANYLVTVQLKVICDPNSENGALSLELLNQAISCAAHNSVAENILVTRISLILDTLFEHISKQINKEPFLLLLKELFKSLHGCKNEVLHRDFQLVSTLSKLRTLLVGPVLEKEKDLLVELILTLPTRLSTLLHYLPHLMKPLLIAIQSPSEHLVTLGMKTLEYWIDSLNPEFLEPAMSDILPELMSSLHSKLGPLGLHPFGHKALTLLGKLGGRNRRYLKAPIGLDYKVNPEHGLRLILTFEPSTSFLVPLDRCIVLARNALTKISLASSISRGPELMHISEAARATLAPEVAEFKSYYRVQALQFLQVCLASVLNLRSPRDSAMPGNGFDKLREMMIGNQQPPHIQVTQQKIDFGVKTLTQLKAERQVLRSLLSVVMGSSNDEDLQKEAKPFAEGVCMHFAMLFAAGASSPPPPPVSSRFAEGNTSEAAASESRSACPSSLKELDPHVFLDAILDIMDDPRHSGAGTSLNALLLFTDSLLTLHHVQESKKCSREAGVISLPDYHSCSTNQTSSNSCMPALDGVNNMSSNGTSSESSSRVRSVQFQSMDYAKKCGYPDVLDKLISRIVHGCYGDSWSLRMCCCQAVRQLQNKLPLDLLAHWLPAIMRGLFMVIRWLPDQCGHLSIELQETLEGLVSHCFVVCDNDANFQVRFLQEESFRKKLKRDLQPLLLPIPTDRSTRDDVQNLVFDTLEVINSEIFGRHSSRRVRSVAGKCLEKICKATQRNGADLLKPLLPSLDKKRLVPLRHVEVQIGTALAITFCLRQKPELVSSPSADLVQVFKDALTIVDHDDSVLGAAMSQYHGDVAAAVVRLRTVCIELLCSAVAWTAFRDDPDQKAVKEPIIRCFFKALTSEVPVIVVAAKEGLRHVTASQPRLLPKELLQSSLKPLLMNLAIHTSLNLPLLKGLSLLLELLSMWFNPNLGDKLLGHLRQWLKPHEILASNHAWSHGEEVLVAAAIMELFHLLPHLPRPEQFLESSHQDCPGLVVLTIELENLLHQYPDSPAPSKLCSPYVKPLTKFLNRYASEATRYFLETARMQNPHYFHRFLSIIKSNSAAPLRTCLFENKDSILKLSSLLSGELSHNDPEKIDAELNAVHLLSVMVKINPIWMKENKSILSAVLTRWKSPGRKKRLCGLDCFKRSAMMETPRLARCLMEYVLYEHSDVSSLIDLLDVFRNRGYVDFSFVDDFLVNKLLPQFSPFHKKGVVSFLLSSLDLGAAGKANPESLTESQLILAIKHVLMPMLKDCFEKNEATDVFDQSVIHTIVKQLLDPPEDPPSTFSDGLRIELLHLATLLVKHMPEKLVPHRKELIKFGWNHLKREDSSCKYYAFVNVCQFLDAYQAPEKIILQVYVALLRTCQPDVRRPQICQALDILVPALPRRMQLGEHKFPVWVRYTKKILVEEGHSLSHLVHIWQLIVRHPRMFYSSRSQFIPQMVNSLNRLGLPQNAQSETRRLAIDLATLILCWEKQRVDEMIFSVAGHEGLSGNAAPDSSEMVICNVSGKSESEELLHESGAAVVTDDQRPQNTSVFHDNSGELARNHDSLASTEMPSIGSERTEGCKIQQQSNAAEESFKTSAAMEEMVVNFLVRMSFVLSEHKDKDLQGIVGHVQWLLNQSIQLWPGVTIRMPYLEKMVLSHQSAGLVPCPSVVNGLQVLDQIATFCTTEVVQSCIPHVCLLIAPTLLCPYEKAVNFLGSLSQKIYKLGLESNSNFSALMKDNVENCILEAADLAGKPTESVNQVSLGAALLLMNVIHTWDPDYCLRITHPLVKILYLYSRKQTHVLQAGINVSANSESVSHSLPDHVPGHVSNSSARSRINLEVLNLRISDNDTPISRSMQPDNSWKPAFGSLVWNMATGLEITASCCQVLGSEHRKAFMQTLAMFMSSGKTTPPAILMALLNVLYNWLLGTSVNSSCLTGKETILFLQRMAQLERAGATSGPIRSCWEKKFLDLVHQLSCDIPDAVTDLSAAEVFAKVERVFLLGLRASDPNQRSQFLAVYNNFIDRAPSSIVTTQGSDLKVDESKLFKRLQFIISIQDWEALSNRFWLNQCLDLLLSILVEDEVITLAPNSAQIPPLLSATKLNVFNPAGANAGGKRNCQAGDKLNTEDIITQQSCSDAQMSSLDVILPTDVKEMIDSHSAFLEQTGDLRVHSLVRALRELCHADNTVAYHCWVLVFPIVWATLQKENQVQLAKPIINLLSKEYHVRQASARPNVVQALLEGISLSQPQPKIPSELIKFLGKTYNAWHIAIPLLESHVMLFPQETRCFDSLSELYRQLNEFDMLAGLWKKRCTVPETKNGLSCYQHGQWEECQMLFSGAISHSIAARTGNDTLKANRGEQSLWVECWCNCAHQLNQWDNLIDFFRDTDQNDELLSCLWKVPDWNTLRSILHERTSIEESLSFLLSRARLALQENSISESQDVIHKCSFRTLHRWWQFPDVGVWPLVPLLENLQPLVELQESSRILSELSILHQARPDYMYSDLNDIMETWRLRLPNEWENLLHWGDVLIWRNHIYNVMINALNDFQESLPQLHQVGYRDKAWSVNQLGAAARKQGQHLLCISSINKLYGYNRMDVQEAFVKIREQAKSYLLGGEEIISGLNLITTTNLEYFKPDHQAEIFRLKGLFHAKLSEQAAANNAFSAAILLNRNLSRSWLSWGQYNDSLEGQDTENHNLEFAATCYLEALRTGSEQSSFILPRLIYFLSFKNPSGEISRTLEQQSDIPTWTLLAWIPQLLVSLQRPEVISVKYLLGQIAIAYPQALYYALRTFLLSLRESAVKQLHEYSAAARLGKTTRTAQGSVADSSCHGDKLNAGSGLGETDVESGAIGIPSDKPPEVHAFEAGREVMESLRSKHGALVQVLESLLTEIGSKFVPKPAERLLAVVHMLLHRCYKAPCANIAEVPNSLRKELGGVCKACFSPEQISKHSWEMKKHRDSFLRDLDPDSSSFPPTLGELVERLKGWKSTLQRSVEDYMPNLVKLEQESKLLQDLSPLDIEIPGQYLDVDSSGSAERSTKLDRIGSNVAIIRRHGSSYRRLKLFAADGNSHFFLVQTPGTGHWSTTATSDERMMQLLRLYSKLLLRFPESRRRHLSFHTPTIVTIWPQVRLVEEDPSYCSCGEAYEVNCSRYGREPDLPITHFKDRCCSENGQILPDPNGVSRLAAYKDIESGVVSENVLSQYMYKTLPSCNHLWTFKKQFCGQFGLSALLCYVLQIGGRSPNKIMFTKNSGLTVQMDLYPVYDTRGLLECNEPVPFRLTRNLVTFFTPFGVEGVFATSLCCAASASMQPNHHLLDMLRLFFRDDIISTQQRRASRSQSTMSSGIMSQNLLSLVTANLDQCRSRIEMVAPGLGKLQAGKDLQSGATQLIESAVSPHNLCRMDPTWHPWF